MPSYKRTSKAGRKAQVEWELNREGDLKAGGRQGLWAMEAEEVVGRTVCTAALDDRVVERAQDCTCQGQ